MAESPDVVIGLPQVVADRSGELLVAERVSGDALNVLNTVVSQWRI